MALKISVKFPWSFLSMIAVQVFLAGLQLLSRLVLETDISIYALLVYRSMVGALFMAVVGFFLERNLIHNIPRSVIGWSFLTGFLWITVSLSLTYRGIQETDATYATLFVNMVPVATLAVSFITRSEKLTLRNTSGKMMIVGSVTCIAGALFYSVLKGKEYHLRHPRGPVGNTPVIFHDNGTYDRVHGSILLSVSSVATAFFFMIQRQMSNVYPAKYWPTVLTCTMGATQSAVIGVFLDRKRSVWKLGWGLQLGTVLYSGVFATGVVHWLISFAIRKEGAIYPSYFNPLSLVIVAVAEASLYRSAISVGNIIGVILIILGSFVIAWGRRNSQATNAEPQRDVEAADAAVQSVSLQGVGNSTERELKAFHSKNVKEKREEEDDTRLS